MLLQLELIEMYPTVSLRCSLREGIIIPFPNKYYAALQQKLVSNIKTIVIATASYHH